MTISYDEPDFPFKYPQGKPRYLMILLHGYGSDGNDLIGLSDFFDKVIPSCIYLSPHAPQKMPIQGYQWFQLSTLSRNELAKGTEASAHYVHELIDKTLEYYDIPEKNLILAGFSQGAMMALYVGLRRKISPCAILAFSGSLTNEDKLAKELTSKPPVYLCHGSRDNVVPSYHSEDAEKILKKYNVPVTKNIIVGEDHTIPYEGLTGALLFLKTYI